MNCDSTAEYAFSSYLVQRLGIPDNREIIKSRDVDVDEHFCKSGIYVMRVKIAYGHCVTTR